MIPKRTLHTLLGVFLFLIGVTITLTLSITILWGEIEAEVFMPQVGDENLKITCPLMIAPWETATVSTTISNTLTDLQKETKPQVNVSIRRDKDTRTISETLILSSHERRTLQWEVDRSDIVFNRLILVNILQRPYRELPSRQGSCSIVMFSLFGLNGNTTLLTTILTGVLASLFGAGLLYFLYSPITDFSKNIIQLNGLFLFLVLVGLITAITRHSGWTLAIVTFAFLVVTTGNVEIFMPHKK
jgi:hypothetical protein